MALSIGSAVVAFMLGAFVFFRASHVKHRVAIIGLTVLLIGGSFLLDNAPYLFDYCPHPDGYVESVGTMTQRFRGARTFHRARLSYRDGDEVRWSSVPVAFYEDVPMSVSIMQRKEPGDGASVTRTQVIVTARTLILAAAGVWLLLACAVKPTAKSGFGLFDTSDG